MSKSLPTINPNNYDDQLFHNNERMQGMLEELFPELGIPYDIVYKILAYLEETHVNGMILPDVIRALSNLNLGTGKGQVIVHVQNGITSVQTREQAGTYELKIEINE